MSRTHARVLQTVAALIAVAAVVAVSCGGRTLVPEKLPGTDLLRPESSSWISVSPDELFVVFTEIDSTEPPPPFPYEHPPAFHIVTLNLRSGAKTQHHLNDLPPGTLSNEPPGPWIELIGHFNAAGWSDDLFHVERWVSPVPTLNPWIAFVPGIPAARRVDPPESVGCSDCPPPGVVRKIAGSRRIKGDRIADVGLADKFSMAYRNGHLSEYLYVDQWMGDGVEFIRSDAHNGSKVVTKEKRFWREVTARRLRISPDERYLAYSIIIRFKLPIPTPGTMELYVYDIQKHRRYRVGGRGGVYTGVSNLLWSADSRRLYFGATDIDAHGLYRVTMKDSPGAA